MTEFPPRLQNPQLKITSLGCALKALFETEDLGKRSVPSHLISMLAYNWPVLTDEDKQWITEQLEKVETTLLTEFHKWASPVELRQRTHAAALRALDAEVESPVRPA